VIERKASEALEFVGLSHKAGQNALALSSGEAQRLGIARALALEPEVMFLDEPTASVDKNNVSVIEDIIVQLKGDQRIIVMTTHDGRQAERLGDRTLRIDKGILRT
jgi:tungstate transport system ATP-binding protein